MKRAILLAGFSNWGKTTQIYSLFDRMRYGYGVTYPLAGRDIFFCVESHSNDDYDAEGFLKAVKRRIPDEDDFNLFCAFCPTKSYSTDIEYINDSRVILTSDPFIRFDELHMLLLKNRWDLHAQLRVDDILLYLHNIKNLSFYIIDADSLLHEGRDHCIDTKEHADERMIARENQILSVLDKIFSV